MVIMSKGKCPECGSHEIEYGTLEWRENQFYYPFECENCGTTGKEWYVEEYAETTIDKKGTRKKNAGNAKSIMDKNYLQGL